MQLHGARLAQSSSSRDGASRKTLDHCAVHGPVGGSSAGVTCARSSSTSRKDRSIGALWATIARTCTLSVSDGARAEKREALASSVAVIPWTCEFPMSRPGFTRFSKQTIHKLYVLELVFESTLISWPT